MPDAITPIVKITRSSKCSLRFATKAKRDLLVEVLTEYGRVANFFIEHFWGLEKPPSKGELLKPIVDLPITWLSARFRKVAAREALSMIAASRKRWGKDKAVMPVHKGNTMYVSSTVARLENAKEATGFDCWLMLRSIGSKVSIDLPIKRHRHFNRLAARGKRLNSYVITPQTVTFAFEVDTGLKRTQGINLGVDTGIKALASLSDGRQLGTDIEAHIERIKRCQHGSKGQCRARRALKQRMDEVARDVLAIPDLRLVVVEKLKGLNKNTKIRRRLNKTMRRSLGAWVYRYWLNRVQSRCEDNRVVFRAVPPQYTSQRCHACGHTERANRSGTEFKCRSCGHTDNADLNAALNIRDRFVLGRYGAQFKPSDLQVLAGS